MKKTYAIHETLPIALIMASVGGFLESYTYLLRGEVFCNAQTGNIVLLALALAQKDIARALYYPLPILAFAAGTWLFALMKERKKPNENLYINHAVLIAVEIVCLFFIGFMPRGAADGLSNVIVAFICSLQYSTFRKVNDMPYATTFCTNNLRLTAENLYHFVIHKDKISGKHFLKYFSVIMSFFFGALFGAAVIRVMDIRAVWICCILLTGVLAAVLISGRICKKEE